MSITKRAYGKTKAGQDVDIFTLTNATGSKAEITNYGGILVSLFVKDKNGKLEDIVLGYDNLDGYLKNSFFFGALIGRHGNRIEKAKFELNGVEYNLAKNDGNNHLHGGNVGFDKVVWDAEIVTKDNVECLKLSYLSKDGEENYPGNLQTTVYYSLTDANELKLEYLAETDKDTVVNLTNHSYFNLGGHASGDVLKHKIYINADKFTVINDECIPNGEIREVTGTVMDFRTAKTIEAGLASDDEQIKFGGGYDHNFVLNVSGKAPEKAAEVYEETSGRVMEVFTTKPGVQLYTGNFIDGTEIGKGGLAYQKRTGLCLETQFFPNAMVHKHFPSPVLKKGEKYNYTTIYKFSTR